MKNNKFDQAKHIHMHHLKNIAIAVLFFISHNTLCQEIEWENTIGGNSYDQLYTVSATADSGFICGGLSQSSVSGDKTDGLRGVADYWIIKFDVNGNIQWQKTFGGGDLDWLYSISQTADGGYICGGWSKSIANGDKTENNMDSSGLSTDFWVIKLDANGNIQWQNTIGGIGQDVLYSVSQTADGGYICGGFSASNISGDKTENCFGNWDYWVVKLDFSGNIQWQKTIGGSNYESLYAVLQTTDGGYICGGKSQSNISGNKTENSMGGDDYWLVKLDSIGNIQWQNTIGGSGDDELYSIIKTTDNGFVCGGWSSSGVSSDKTENCLGGYDYWIIKLDSNGNIQWQNTIGGTGDDNLNSISPTVEGGYICGGYSKSNISGDKSENSYGQEDYWVVKLDESGNIQWQNTIGGSLYDYLYSVCQTADGNYICGGYSSSNSSGDKKENCMSLNDYWVIKLYGKNNLITGKTFMDSNSNGVQDANEPALTQHKITEQNTGQFSFSQPNGFYSISILDSGSFIVSPTNNLTYYNTVPVSNSAYFSGINQIDSLNNFAFQPQGLFNDLCVSISPLGRFRSGFNATYMINYGNYGTTSLSGDVIFFPYSNVTYISSSTTPTTVSLDSVVWSLALLAPFQTGSIIVTVNVDTILPIGTLINSNVRIEPVVNDVNPSCNYSSWEVYTTNSNGPNAILVSEDTLTTSQISSPPFLDYIIYFQNTGNDTTFSIKVLNPIDTLKLDLTTFEYVNSSHPVNLNWVSYQRNMEFKFDNILLPDSGVNEPMSHAFVHYRIKPKSNLVAGNTIANNAYIYYDFNTPGTTNTIVTTVVSPAGYSNYQKDNSVQLIPNPFSKNSQLTFANDLHQSFNLKIFDVTGRSVLETTTTSNIIPIERRNMDSGVYIYQLVNVVKKETFNGKMIVE